MATPFQSYVPTALIVVISWFSFWLDVEAVPGRVVNYCTRRKQRKARSSTKSLSEQVHSLVAQYKEKRG
ncbi:hypothetical protein OSTOST_14005, partial [Ostertagia ostertagi]